MAFLIDTDVIIYSLKGHQGVLEWMARNQNLPKFISAVSYGELVYGAHKSKHPERNLATAHRVAQLFQVVDVGAPIMDLFGDIKAKLEKTGTRLDDMDLLIACTAMYMNFRLVTNNTSHFERVPDLVLENWNNAGD